MAVLLRVLATNVMRCLTPLLRHGLLVVLRWRGLKSYNYS